MPIAACLLFSCLNVVICSLKVLSILDSPTVCLIHSRFSYRSTCTSRIFLGVLIACILSRDNKSNLLYCRSKTAKYLQGEIDLISGKHLLCLWLAYFSFFCTERFHIIIIWWLRQEYSWRYCFSTSTGKRGGNEKAHYYFCL